MNDKTKTTKPNGPEKTPAGVAATLASCGVQSDASSVRISAAIISDNLANGATGSAITSGARGLSSNVGQCVADAYDGKKPGIADRVGSFIGNLTDSFKSAASSLKEDAKLVGGQMVMSGVSVVTNDTPGVIKEHQAQTDRTISAASGPGR